MVIKTFSYIYSLYLRWRGMSVGRHVIFHSRITVRGNRKGIHIADRVEFQKHTVIANLRDNSSIHIGSDTLICDGVILSSHEEIHIGSNVMIAAYSYVVDHDHGTELGAPIKSQECYGFPITIGDDVWIGTHSVLTKGVTVGCGAVIGAGSVVTKSVINESIVFGSPAKYIKMRGGAIT